MRRFANLTPFLIIGSIFGPYVFPNLGIRLEQIVIYLLACFWVPWGFLHLRKIPRAFHGVLFWWSTLLLIILLSIIDNNLYRNGPASVLAGLDDYLSPIALSLTLGFTLPLAIEREGLSESYFLRLIRFFTGLLFYHALLQIVQILVDLKPLLSQFWAPSLYTGEAVAEAALRMGRVTGIFNTPAQHGLAYGLGLVLFGLLLNRTHHKRWYHYVWIAGITTGGVLGMSKNFLFLGFPFFLATQISWRMNISNFTRWSHRILFLAISAPIVLYIIGFVSKQEIWTGMDIFFSSVLNKDWLYVVSGGRVSAVTEGTLGNIVASVAESNLLLGTGFASLKAVDNQFLSIFMGGGLLGIFTFLGFFSLFFGKLLRAAWRRRRNAFGKAGLAFASLLLLATSGAPIFTTNRSGTLVWVFSLVFLFTSTSVSLDPE